MIFITGGQCKITIEGTPYLCKKNQVVFLPPDVLHKFETLNEDFHQPHIHFDLIYGPLSELRTISFQNRNDMSEQDLSLISENVFKDYPIPYVFTPIDLPKFQKIFFDIIEIFQEKNNNYVLSYKSNFLLLLSLILEQFEISSTTVTNENQTLQMIKNFIDKNFQSIITLEMIEKQFYINKYTLLRAFKKIYGANIIKYYRTKRIDYAKMKLCTTDLSISAIGEKLNFSDVFTFSRFFKIYTGMSPSQYRATQHNLYSK